MTRDERRWVGPRTRNGEAQRSDKGPEKLGNLLPDFLKDSGVQDDLARQSALGEWDECVGRKIAQVTHPRSVADGTLIVEVRSSAWLMELNMMKGEILDRVNADRETPIRKLVFVMSPES